KVAMSSFMARSSSRRLRCAPGGLPGSAGEAQTAPLAPSGSETQPPSSRASQTRPSPHALLTVVWETPRASPVAAARGGRDAERLGDLLDGRACEELQLDHPRLPRALATELLQGRVEGEQGDRELGGAPTLPG